MAQSGWYDDPDGTAGRLRYWDGTQWTTDTMPKPDQTAVLPPVGADDRTAVLPPTPPDQTAVLPPVVGAPYGPVGAHGPAGAYGSGGAYGQYGAQAWTPTATPPPNPYAAQGPARPPRRGLHPLLALGILALLVGLVAGGYVLLTRPKSGPVASPTTRPSGQVSLPSAFPTVTLPTVTVPGQSGAPTMPEPSAAPPLADCPVPASGQLTDGTITVAMPSTWEDEPDFTLDWSDCYSVAGRKVSANWWTSAIVANYAADDTTSQQFAEDAWAWNVDSNYEGGSSNVTLTGDKVTKKEAVTVGGLPGYKLSGQVTISGLAGVSGDEVTILVLEKADKSHSILLTTSAIGDAASTADVDALWASLKVG